MAKKMPTLAGKAISQNGLGLMRLTMPGFALSDEETFKVLRSAVAAGVNLWNGADYYGSPDNNSLHLMKRYFTKYPEDAEKVVFTLKTGMVDRRTLQMDCSPEALRRSYDSAASILGDTKKIDVFGIARIDKNVPVEDTVQALDQMRREGKFAGIELSEVSADTIKRAAQIAKIDMLEAEASLWTTNVFENGVADVCAELGIVLVAHTPLGFGMLTGQMKTLDDVPAPLRQLPRYQPETFPINLRLVNAVEELAKEKQCTTPQLALSWLKSRTVRAGPVIVPIAGARSTERVRENAQTVQLGDADFEKIAEILRSFPVEGYRTMPQMAAVNEY